MKKIGLLLATVMVLNSVAPVAFCEWKNPLTEYNLYEDTHPKISGENLPELQEMASEYDFESKSQKKEEDTEKHRNDVLRESSKNFYADLESAPAWESGPSYYPEPSIDSIIEKYRTEDYAGCLQECTSYVRQYPTDTLGFYYLAMCYSKISDKDNAIAAYEKVILLNDNPMIVKYATNGRNCIMGNENEACFENVDEPILRYPYKDIAENEDLTPVDPEVLVDRNIKKLKQKLSPLEMDKAENNNEKDGDKKIKIVLPFGRQDEKLDEFINAPYGDGFSPELKKEYKQLQLRKLMDTVNTTEDAPDSPETQNQEIKNLKEIQKFDDKHSDAGLVKLAYAEPSNMFEQISKDPEYIRQKQELEELQMLLGSEKSKNDRNDMVDLIPYMSEQGDKKLSPEVIQSLMMQSMMGNLTL